MTHNQVVSIPRHVVTVAKQCTTAWRFFDEWTRAGWNASCVDQIEMRRVLKRHGLLRGMNHPIHVADISRWLILYERGGAYVDSDVRPLFNNNFRFNDHIDQSGLVMGLEAVVSPAEQRFYRIFRPRSMCMWAALARPGSPILLELARYVHARAQREWRSPEPWDEYIHKTTGPTAVTDFLLPRLKQVQPVHVFGCAQPHSNARKCRSQSWCVHTFQGSWK